MRYALVYHTVCLKGKQKIEKRQRNQSRKIKTNAFKRARQGLHSDTTIFFRRQILKKTRNFEVFRIFFHKKKTYEKKIELNETVERIPDQTEKKY